jgi:hypothetical protein
MVAAVVGRENTELKFIAHPGIGWDQFFPHAAIMPQAFQMFRKNSPLSVFVKAMT